MKITIEIDNTDELIGCLPKLIELLGAVGVTTPKEDIFVSGPPVKHCKGCNKQFAFENEDTLYCSPCELKRAKHLKELAELKVSIENPRKGVKVKAWKTFTCKTCGVEFKKQAHFVLYCAKHRDKHGHLNIKTAKAGKKKGRPKRVKSAKINDINVNIDVKKDDDFKLIYDDEGAVIGSTNYPPNIKVKHPAAADINERIEEGEFGEITI